MKKGLCVASWIVVAIGLILFGTSISQAQGKGPIKIGFITALSGPAAANGKDMLSGLELYLEEIGYEVAGRKIELITEDDEAIPTTALTKARKLVEKDGVHAMTGVLSTARGYALAPYLDSKEMPTTYPVVSGDDLTQRKPAKWIVRTGYSSSQPLHPFGEYAYKVLKYRNIDVIGLDFSFGWEAVGGFQRTFEELGERFFKKCGSQ